MASIKIYDKSLKFRGIIDNYESLIVTRIHGDRSSVMLTIGRGKNNVEYLVKKSYIRLSDRREIYQITETPTTVDAKKNEIQIIATDILWMLEGRLTNVTTAPISYTGKSVEWLIKQYIKDNVVNPTDPDRAIGNISLASNQDRGSVISDTVKQTYLSEDVKRLLAIDQMGITGKLVDGKIEVDLYQGVDRSIGNAEGRPPVSFALKYDNIQSVQENHSITFTKTHAYIAGGAEESRVMTSYGAATGMDSREIFLAFDDITDVDELKSRGKAALVEDVAQIEASIDALKGSFVYGQDYDLGDIVTVNGSPLRVVQAEEVYQTGQGNQLQLTFGAVEMRLNKQVESNSARISDLETRSSGSSIAKHSETIGNGTDTEIVVTHGFETQDVVVIVREAASPYRLVSPEVRVTDANTIALKFTEAPSVDQYQAVIIGY